MILTTERIRQLIKETRSESPENRLLITPILDWPRQGKSGNCSVDVRLGQRFTVPRRTRLSCLDHLHAEHEQRLTRYKDVYFVPVGDYFVLHPSQFILGETLEWLHLPRSLGAYVVGRSSWGRDGLIIATATGVHAGYSGVLTLEISNVGQIPIYLYPGLRIAQLFLHTVDYARQEPLSTSVFAGSTGPSSGDAVGDDAAVVRFFKSELERRYDRVLEPLPSETEEE